MISPIFQLTIFFFQFLFMPIGAIPKDQFSSIKATTDQTSTENSSNVSHVDNVSEEISELSIHENQQQSDDSKEVEYIVYENELQMPCIMRLIQKDLSEPYSIYTYRYFIHNWPHLCFMVSNDLRLRLYAYEIFQH